MSVKIKYYKVEAGTGMDCMGGKEVLSIFYNKDQAIEYARNHKDDWCKPTIWEYSFVVADTADQAETLDPEYKVNLIDYA